MKKTASRLRASALKRILGDYGKQKELERLIIQPVGKLCSNRCFPELADQKRKHHAAPPLCWNLLISMEKSYQAPLGLSARALEFSFFNGAAFCEVRASTWMEIDFLINMIWIVQPERMSKRARSIASLFQPVPI